MIVSIYVHADKDYVYSLGESLGLSGKVLDVFKYLGYEHRLTFEVDERGVGKVIQVDGKDVKRD